MRDYLSPADFNECPVWRFDEDADGYFPVRALDDIPEMLRDLRIFAGFTTSVGRVLSGYIVGVENIFSMGVFFGERTFHFNKNLPDLSKEQAEEFLAESGLAGELSYETLFPLRYETKWGGTTFNDFTGVFDMPS